MKRIFIKRILKLLSPAVLFFVFTISTEAQVKHHKKEKKEMKKQLHLTTKQKKAKVEQLNKENKDKLEAILTPEQKEKLKQTKNKPRRGVTNMPNERIAK